MATLDWPHRSWRSLMVCSTPNSVKRSGVILYQVSHTNPSRRSWPGSSGRLGEKDCIGRMDPLGLLPHYLRLMDYSQGQLRFDDVGSGSGLDRWREQFNAAQRELARKLGLPIDRQVEVWLKDGLRLRGVLRLCEQR